MFDFDEISVEDYLFTYHTESIINSAFHKHIEKLLITYTKEIKNNFIFEYVKSVILKGYHKHAEFEQEWGRLKYYIESVYKEYFKNPEMITENVLKKVYILLDQALLLEKEGFPIPN